jgi:hypothetical protein
VKGNPPFNPASPRLAEFPYHRDRFQGVVTRGPFPGGGDVSRRRLSMRRLVLPCTPSSRRTGTKRTVEGRATGADDAGSVRRELRERGGVGKKGRDAGAEAELEGREKSFPSSGGAPKAPLERQREDRASSPGAPFSSCRPHLITLPVWSARRGEGLLWQEEKR